MTPEQKTQLVKALVKGHIEQLIQIKKEKEGNTVVLETFLDWLIYSQNDNTGTKVIIKESSFNTFLKKLD